MPVVIAGMHRSGTSLVARALNICGLYLGPEHELIAASRDNPKGYWENVRFVRINDGILSALGGGWDLVPEFPADWAERPDLDPLRVEALNLISSMRDHRHWGWKDPRNSLTLPFWMSLVDDLQVVICVRHPLEIILSLASRGYSSREFGQWLFAAYYKSVLAVAEPGQRIVTHFDSYFADARYELERLTAFLALPANEDSLAQASSTISIADRNYRVVPADARQNGLADEVIDQYASICAQAGPLFDLISKKTGRARRNADAEPHSQAVDPLELLRTSQEHLRAEFCAREEGLKAELRSTKTRLQKTIDRLQSSMADLKSSLRDQQHQANAREERLRARFEGIEAMLRENVDRLEVSNAVLGTSLRQQQDQNRNLRQSLAGKDRKVNALRAENAELRETAIALKSSLRDQQSLVSQLRQRLGEEEVQAKALQRKYDDLQESVTILNSSSVVKLLQVYWNLRDRLFPLGTRRRDLYDTQRRAVRYVGAKGWSVARRLLGGKGRSQIQNLNASSESTSANDELMDDAVQAQAEVAQLNPKRMFVGLAGGQGGWEYVPLTDTDFDAQLAKVKLIAFYLTQFHPIPENDEWWGKGFTEWTNVSKALPQFVGHYQPRLPGELGFYDLRLVEVQERQIELARKYGVYGFCFHYYWFAGKRLLERPLDLFLEHQELDFPFCICWANENWTRRWDGAERELLIAQEHTESSDLQFIMNLAPILRDERYIKIDGRPLLIIYRPPMLSDPPRVVELWREYCIKNGIGNPYLIAAQTFDFKDPRPLGFDAAVQFPPHNLWLMPIINGVEFLNPDYQGTVYDYQAMVDELCNADTPKTDYTLFDGVFPGWDNEARTPGRGRTFTNSSPEAYGKWLQFACRRAMEKHEPDRRFVFINAWNEWAEGAYLEPDRRFGYAYLHTTADCMRLLVAGSTTRVSVALQGHK